MSKRFFSETRKDSSSSPCSRREQKLGGNEEGLHQVRRRSSWKNDSSSRYGIEFYSTSHKTILISHQKRSYNKSVTMERTELNRLLFSFVL